jgi:hypothetical protein
MNFNRTVAAALTGALALTSLNMTPAQAGSAKPQVANAATTTDLSARRYRGGNNAAVVGAVVGLFGTIAAIAAAERYREGYYYRGSPYYGSYGYARPYGYAPVYRYRYRH